MKSIKVLIIGFPGSQIYGAPLETLAGIRVRDWALFSMLGEYGIDAEYFVPMKTKVAADLEARYQNRLVRNQSTVLERCRSGAYDCVILSGTKLQEIQRQVPFVSDIEGADFFGAFCYDNDPSPIDMHFAENLIGVTFTSPLHKRNWDSRRLNIPSILINTGQVPKGPAQSDGDESVLFMGYIHQPSHLEKLVRMAQIDSGRQFHVVSGFFRKLEDSGKTYHNLANMRDRERNEFVHKYIETVAGECPPNLNYHFLPPGEERDLLETVSVGIDFSWNSRQVLENSKICHYLTYGISPIAHLPAPSFRYVHRFRYGKVIPFESDAQEWVKAIQDCSAQVNLEERNRVRNEAGQYFGWENVAFQVASFLVDHYRQRQLAP